MQDMVDYWLTEWDRSNAASAMNRYEHLRVEVDGVPIHVMRVPGAGPNPSPLVLTHGWPWTFWGYKEVVGPLSDPSSHGGDPADAFDVFVPSLPGFGFSTPLTRSGIDTRAVVLVMSENSDSWGAVSAMSRPQWPTGGSLLTPRHRHRHRAVHRRPGINASNLATDPPATVPSAPMS